MRRHIFSILFRLMKMKKYEGVTVATKVEIRATFIIFKTILLMIKADYTCSEHYLLTLKIFL